MRVTATRGWRGVGLGLLVSLTLLWGVALVASYAWPRRIVPLPVGSGAAMLDGGALVVAIDLPAPMGLEEVGFDHDWGVVAWQPQVSSTKSWTVRSPTGGRRTVSVTERGGPVGRVSLGFVGVVAAFGWLAWGRIRREWRAYRWRGRGLCGGCGYDLRHTAGACPECGTARG